MKKTLQNAILFFLSLLLICPPNLLAADTPRLALELQTDDWKGFEDFIKETDRQDKIDGYSYLISGSLAAVGGLVGYYSSADNFAKAVYSISQTIGVAAIGFGGYKLFVGNENKLLYRSIKATNLSIADREMLLYNYRLQKGAEESRIRKVKALTHGAIALLNIYNAMRESNNDLRTALYFIGGVNFFAAVSFTF
ncbi:MAG: hypothetical protein K2X47_20300 [Bdellovibrionales bacterium]|nr:hypothetical protein [Bdellovibrionales bacterium]